MTSNRHPIWLITYENVDVTDELGPMIVSAEYTDHVEGESDELTLTLEDRAGRWRAGWWPSDQDTITVRMGYEGQPLLDAGTFAVDEVGLRGPPDTVSISAQAAPKTEATREVKHRAFEGLSLADLVRQLATELELEVVGAVADLALERVTQHGQTNLAFLRRLASSYGYAFSVRPPKLVFYALADLDQADTVVTLDRTDLSRGYDFKGSTQDTYVACVVSYLDPRTKQLREARVDVEHLRQAVTVSQPIEGDATGSSGAIIPERDLYLANPYLSGEDVLSWQTFVAGMGLDPGPLDGVYGPLTRRGTVLAQQQLGTPADGVVGPETIRLARDAGWGRAMATPAAASGAAPGRVLKVTERCESAEQAIQRARAELAATNRLKVTGSFSVPTGDSRLVAGATVELTGLGRLSGKYLIQTSKHKVSRSGGYTTSVEVTCV